MQQQLEDKLKTNPNKRKTTQLSEDNTKIKTQI